MEKKDLNEFQNKNTNSLKDFIISENMNELDLLKLAELNAVNVDVRKGWYPLLIELIKALNQNGWDRKITCIKEKYGRLAFYTDPKYNSIVDEFEEKSELICETCGKEGELRYLYGNLYTACEEHIIKIV